MRLTGRKIRCLTIVDNYSSKYMTLLRYREGYQVVEELRLFQGVSPKKIQVHNGYKFISKEMDS